jgi:Ca2+-binding EF-hand superfamily protein
MSRFQPVVVVFLATPILILCTVSNVDCGAGTLPKGLPPWFAALDKNRDGQVSLSEWLAGGKKLAEFREFDLNDDGLITAEEVFRVLGSGNTLKLRKGQASYEGAIEPPGKEQFRSKKAFKIFTITLQEGKTYQIEMVSQVFFAFLYLEGPNGTILGRHDSGGNGRQARIVHRAAENGKYRIIATSQGGFRPGAFSLSVRVVPGAGASAGVDVVKGLPQWFRELDKDQDGQISLQEWQQGGKKRGAFREYDLNDDGFITVEEVLRVTRSRAQLKFQQGRARYDGTLEPTDDEKFRGLKYSKIFTIDLKTGATYQFDHTSQGYKPVIALEDPDGKIAAIGGSPGKGTNARVVHQAAKTGTYRVLVTSEGGGKRGAFSLSVRTFESSGSTLPKGLPPWFEALDKNGDGQVSLGEWLAGGKKLAEFRKLDLDDDGLITPEEVLGPVKSATLLKLVKGQATYTGAIDGTDERYQGQKLAKILTVRLEAGKTYQIDHMSRAFDAYLYLEGPSGAILAQDDDGGGMLNSRIVHRAAKTGTYRLIATSLGGSGTGAFSLSVRLVGGK